MAERAFIEDVDDIDVIHDPVPAEVSAAMIAAAEYNRSYLSRYKPNVQLLVMEYDVRCAVRVIAVRPDPSLPDGYEMSWIKGEATFPWPCRTNPGRLPSLHRTTAYFIPHSADVGRMLMAYGDAPEIKAWRKSAMKALGRSWPAKMRAEVTPSGLAYRAEWRAWRHEHNIPSITESVHFGMKCPVPLRPFAPRAIPKPVAVPEAWQPVNRDYFTFRDSEGEFNPPRSAGKASPEPWPTSAEREWSIHDHKFSWELHDAAYEAMRSWAALVEAGDPDAVALAQASQIQVVDRYPSGKPDEMQDPDWVFIDISCAIHNGIHDDPDDTEASFEAASRRYRRRVQIGRDIILQIFGFDPCGLIWRLTQDCDEQSGLDRSHFTRQMDRFETRLGLGIANERDLAIAAVGDCYWETEAD